LHLGIAACSTQQRRDRRERERERGLLMPSYCDWRTIAAS
jgi:hypothetical protein